MQPYFSRNRYDTFIIMLYATGKEHLLPRDFRKSIPYSTATTWRNAKAEDFRGMEFRTRHKEASGWDELFLQRKKLEKTVRVLTKVWISIAAILKPVLNAKMHADKVLNEIQRLFTILPKRFVLKLAGISLPTFYYRISRLNNKCLASPWSICLKRHPLQLAYKEVNLIRDLLMDKAFACWPVSSIAHYAKRNNLLFAGLSTWYKYVALLGLNRKFKKPPEKTNGIISSRPNEFLHVDTTFYRLEDGTKAAITFVSDNFSRHILGWSISLKHGAENVKKALNRALKTIRQYHPNLVCATLVADGGSENNAYAIEEWLTMTVNPEISKVIALKDIAFSNSPIEAINKIMKRYIRYYDPGILSALYTCIENAVHDYSTIRPHGALNGLIPLEAYSQNLPDRDFSEQMCRAKTERIALNRKNACQSCS